jgi:hypothetical protein
MLVIRTTQDELDIQVTAQTEMALTAVVRGAPA